MLYWLFDLHKKNIQQDLLLILCLVCTTTELSKLLTSCMTAVKNMLLSTAKMYMKDSVRIYSGLLKLQVKD